jgi:hypothetical protein
MKGYEAIFVPNLVRLFVNGNPAWLVPAGLDERRFATLDVSDAHKQDIPYFQAMVGEMRSGGYGRLLWELLQFDLSTVELRKIPTTEALLDQKINSLTSEHGWWLDVLKNGRLPLADRDNGARCPAGPLYTHYIEHAKKVGTRRRAIETAIGIFLLGVAPGLSGKVEQCDMPDGMGGWEPARGTVYTFPPLAECRDAFAARLRQEIEWPAPEAWLSRRETDGAAF